MSCSRVLVPLRLVGAIAAGALIISLTGGSATADEPGAGADHVAAAIEAVAPQAEVVAPDSATSGVLMAESQGVRVAIPQNGSGDIGVGSPVGVDLVVGLPVEAEGARATVAEDGTVVYDGAGATDVAVQVTGGGFRVQTVLADASASSEFVYDLGGLTPTPTAGGGVTLALEGDGYSVGVGALSAPWAFDATGRPVPTRYRIEGTTVVQEVDHALPGVVYPVVADPTYKFDCGIVTCTISFDLATTRNIRDGLNLSAIGTGAAAAVGGMLAVAVGVAGALFAAKLAVDALFAGRFYENGNCFGYLFPRAPIFGLSSFWPKEIRRGTRNCA